jgi:hypothetical protein
MKIRSSKSEILTWPPEPNRWQKDGRQKNEPAWISASHFSAISGGQNCSHFAQHFGKTKRNKSEIRNSNRLSRASVERGWTETAVARSFSLPYRGLSVPCRQDFCFFIPEGWLRLAQRFSVGSTCATGSRPEGTVEMGNALMVSYFGGPFGTRIATSRVGSVFPPSGFGFLSDFGFRISDLEAAFTFPPLSPS